MRKAFIVFVIAALCLCAVSIASAERGYRESIRERIEETKDRINRGVDHGTLSRYEAKEFYRDLRRIENRIDRMRSDGLSHREREIIERDLDRLDRSIRREKRDNRTDGYDHRYR